METNHKIFFTADTHFGHKNIIEGCNRPFESVEDMDSSLITNWNSTVGKDDLVYCLGDFSLKSEKYANEYLEQLNGKITLLLGNHDKFRYNVETIMKIKYYEIVIILCHYPMLVWPHAHHGALHLFGHIHGRVKGIGRSMDVGVDSNNYRPVSIDVIIEKLSKIEIHYSL